MDRDVAVKILKCNLLYFDFIWLNEPSNPHYQNTIAAILILYILRLNILSYESFSMSLPASGHPVWATVDAQACL